MASKFLFFGTHAIAAVVAELCRQERQQQEEGQSDNQFHCGRLGARRASGVWRTLYIGAIYVSIYGVPDEPHGDLGARVNLELRQDVRDVHAYGAFGDHQSFGNLSIG
jgi:hypothetical protein